MARYEVRNTHQEIVHQGEWLSGVQGRAAAIADEIGDEVHIYARGELIEIVLPDEAEADREDVHTQVRHSEHRITNRMSITSRQDMRVYSFGRRNLGGLRIAWMRQINGVPFDFVVNTWDRSDGTSTKTITVWRNAVQVHEFTF